MIHLEWESVAIGPKESLQRPIGDFLMCRNPIKECLKEAEDIFGSNRWVASIISFGCGAKAPLKQEDLTDPGKLLDSDAKKIAVELKDRLRSPLYHRFSVAKGTEAINITHWDEDSLGEILNHTGSYISEIEENIDGVVEQLCEKEGVVTLGQISQYLERVTNSILPE